MKIWSKNILKNLPVKEYTFLNYKNKIFKNKKIFLSSPHIAWSDLPSETKTLSVVLYESEILDDVEVLWIHWIGFNINPRWKYLPENANELMKNKFIQNFSNLKINDKNNNLCKDTFYLENNNLRYYPNFKIKIIALNSYLSLNKNFKIEKFFEQIKKHKIKESDINFTIIKTNFPSS